MEQVNVVFQVLHAGALCRPVSNCLDLFCRLNPGLAVEMEGSGSRECARRVLDGGRYDVIVLADQALFAELLVPEFVDAYLVFATDQMVIAYNRYSQGSAEINGENWMEVLLGRGVRYARSDQNLDPCGYRTLMVWQLAEKYYHQPALFAALDAGCPAPYIYPKSIDLAGALLEGKVDYAFLYSSVARQLGFPYLSLPSRINLSNPAHAENYALAKVTVMGKTQGEKTIVHGEPIEFAVAVPRNTPHPDLANAFVNLLTGTEGSGVLEECGLTPC